jgi:hypothetical protein
MAKMKFPSQNARKDGKIPPLDEFHDERIDHQVDEADQDAVPRPPI